MLNVAIAAASPAVREGLAQIVGQDPELALVGIADAVAGLFREDTLAADVAVIDWEAPDDPWLDAEPGQLLPAIVLLTDAAPGGWLQRAFEHRAGALLPRSASAEAIRAGVMAAGAGLVALDRGLLARSPLSQFLEDADAAQGGEPLTEREAEVLALLADGYSNKAIARLLRVSEHTAKFHVSAILAKLGGSTRAEAVAIGIRRGLISL